MYRLWRVALALVVGFVAVVGLVGTVETFVQQASLRESSATKDDTIEGLSADVREMRRRLDRLADQNADLVELLHAQGLDAPAALVARPASPRVIVRNRDNDDSDDADTVVVTPSQPATVSSQPTPSGPSSSPPRVQVPEVDAPEPIGEVTDNVKDMAGGLVPLLQ